MKITEVRIKLKEDPDDRLQAFCSITLDHAFVIRDLKIIEGSNGPFVAMPSRKIMGHCPHCRYKNHLRAAYCNHCGGDLQDDPAFGASEGRTVLYADIAHPINAACREMIQNRVIREFHAERERAQRPDYVSKYDEEYDAEPASDLGLPKAPALEHGAPPVIVPAPESVPNRPHFEIHEPSPKLAAPTSGSAPPCPAAEKPRPPCRGNDEFGAGIF